MVVPFPGVWCYLSDYYAPAAEAILDELRLHLPGVAWSARSDWAWPPAGECIDEPALVLLVAPLARESFRLFFGPQSSPVAPSGFVADTSVIHAA